MAKEVKSEEISWESQDLLRVLEERFAENGRRHPGVEWAKVAARLRGNGTALRTLAAMEASGGDPDVVGLDSGRGEILFVDCSPETPKARVSVCYDRAGLDSRKEHKPKTSAVDLATEMGAELLTEEEYLALQAVGDFDRKTSSWVKTPDSVRAKGGALYCEQRYGRVFTGHNGAQSYYAVRGFRVGVRV